MSQLNDYRHKVQYYETDQMGIVHHSNYIRWFEEARTDYMEQMGLGYDVMEDQGILSPVLAVDATYLRMIYYGDTAIIRTYIKKYNGIKLTVGYEVFSEKTGKKHCSGQSKHCFLSKKGNPLSLKQTSPAFHEMFLEGLREYEEYKEQEEKEKKEKKERK